MVISVHFGYQCCSIVVNQLSRRFRSSCIVVLGHSWPMQLRTHGYTWRYLIVYVDKFHLTLSTQLVNPSILTRHSFTFKMAPKVKMPSCYIEIMSCSQVGSAHAGTGCLVDRKAFGRGSKQRPQLIILHQPPQHDNPRGLHSEGYVVNPISV